jgi:hypothetical protein
MKCTDDTKRPKVEETERLNEAPKLKQELEKQPNQRHFDGELIAGDELRA